MIGRESRESRAARDKDRESHERRESRESREDARIGVGVSDRSVDKSAQQEATQPV